MTAGSFVILYLAYSGDLSADIFGVYMFSGGGVYGIGKWQDERTARTEIEAANPAPVNTTINQPGIANVAGNS